MKTLTTAGHARVYVNIFRTSSTADVTSYVEGYSVNVSIYGNSTCTLTLAYNEQVYASILRNSVTPSSADSKGEKAAVGLFAVRNRVTLYLRHPLQPNKYVQAFVGEIRGYSIGQAAGATISVTATGFMDAMDRVLFPMAADFSATKMTARSYIFSATTGITTENLPQVIRGVYDRLLQGVKSFTNLKDLINLALNLATAAAPGGTYNLNAVKDRIVQLGDVPAGVDTYQLLSTYLQNRLDLRTLSGFLQSLVTLMTGEFFCDAQGAIVLKPPMWAEGIPKQHFVHPALVEGFNQQLNYAKRITRVVLHLFPASLGVASVTGATQPVQGVIALPVVTYIVDDKDTCVVAETSPTTGDGGIIYSTMSASAGDEATDFYGKLEPSPYEKAFGVNCLETRQDALPEWAVSSADRRKKLGETLYMPYARCIADGQNLAVDTCTVTLKVPCPWFKPGFNICLDPQADGKGGIDKVYYLVGVSHQGNVRGGGRTVLSCSGGRNFNEYAARVKALADATYTWIVYKDAYADKVKAYAGELLTDRATFGEMSEWLDGTTVLSVTGRSSSDQVFDYKPFVGIGSVGSDEQTTPTAPDSVPKTADTIAAERAEAAARAAALEAEQQLQRGYGTEDTSGTTTGGVK